MKFKRIRSFKRPHNLYSKNFLEFQKVIHRLHISFSFLMKSNHDDGNSDDDVDDNDDDAEADDTSVTSNANTTFNNKHISFIKHIIILI